MINIYDQNSDRVAKKFSTRLTVDSSEAQRTNQPTARQQQEREVLHMMSLPRKQRRAIGKANGFKTLPGTNVPFKKNQDLR